MIAIWSQQIDLTFKNRRKSDEQVLEEGLENPGDSSRPVTVPATLPCCFKHTPLLGCVILGVGIWIRVAPTLKTYIDESNDFNYLYTGAYVLIVVGVIIMVVGFLGCCGAIRESQCMLALFFVFLFIIFAVLLGAGIWAVVEKNKLKKMVDDALMEKVQKYNDKDDKGEAKNFMDKLQEELKCCGAGNGQKDYSKYMSNPPKSCGEYVDKFHCCGAVSGFSDYKHDIDPDEPDPCPLATLHNPCSEQFFNFLSQNMIIVAGVAIGIGVIMLLGMVFSMCLCCAIREEAMA